LKLASMQLPAVITRANAASDGSSRSDARVCVGVR